MKIKLLDAEYDVKDSSLSMLNFYAAQSNSSAREPPNVAICKFLTSPFLMLSIQRSHDYAYEICQSTEIL